MTKEKELKKAQEELQRAKKSRDEIAEKLRVANLSLEATRQSNDHVIAVLVALSANEVRKPLQQQANQLSGMVRQLQQQLAGVRKELADERSTKEDVLEEDEE